MPAVDDEDDEEEEEPLEDNTAELLLLDDDDAAAGAGVVVALPLPLAMGWRVNLIVVGDVADKLLCNVVLCDLCADADAEDVAAVLFACFAFKVAADAAAAVGVAVVWLLPPPECAADFSISASRSSSSSGMPPMFHSSSYSKFVSFDSLEFDELLLLLDDALVVVFAFPAPINSVHNR